MDNIMNVTGGQGGNAFLILGERKTALIDCGMAYCAENLISNLKQVLQSRALHYVLISHSHYDHIGAIPYLRKEWPNMKVLGAEYAKQILKRQTALTTIRNLSRQAPLYFGAAPLKEYNDALLKVDQSILDGDSLDLGGMSIRVIETRGHTKCSLSFLVNKELLFSSESTGCMSQSGKIYSAFLTSCSEAIHSVQICEELHPRFIISPHFGLVNQNDTHYYWKNCFLSIKETKDSILHLAEKGYGEDQILIEYERLFRDEKSRLEQPNGAFQINAQSMIKTVLKER
jgi:2-aminobenzoylacetyl-CoA thioesterase